MFCGKYLGGEGAGDLGLKWSSSLLTYSSSTCSLKGELGKGSMISVDWTEKSIGES